MIKNITDDIIYAGVSDHDIDLFEGQYIVPNGMAYNSYIIKDEKTAIMDTVDAKCGVEWLANIEEALGGTAPDYLIIQHMEPDHSANIGLLTEKYPEVTLVGNDKTFVMMDRFYKIDEKVKRLSVKNEETLSLGKHTLTFIMAPMVHWPEVMVTYDAADKVVFSADGFGKFGAFDTDEDWACEARRYYFGIVGKYGMQVAKLLNTLAALDVNIICPLHGPVLSENLEYYIGKYETWSSYEPEDEGVMIAYASVYGNTRKAARMLAEKLEEKGCPKVVLADLAREDMAECVEDAFRYSKLVLASVTYNGDIFPCMKEFINALTERNYQNRSIGFVENGTWAPASARIMKQMFEKSRNITMYENTVTVNSGINEETAKAVSLLADEIMA